MFMHDHEKIPAGGRFCPLLKDVCRSGWVPAMGEDEKTKERPVCTAWRPVTVMVGGPNGKPQEVHDCTLGWLPDLMVQVSQESYSAGAATESARNHIAAQATSIRRMSMAMLGIARRQGVSKDDIKAIEAEIQEVEKQAQLLAPPEKPN